MHRFLCFRKRKPAPEPAPAPAPVPAQNPDCRLLNLPNEIIEAICCNVPITQRLHLAHTCRCLYNIARGKALHRVLMTMSPPPGRSNMEATARQNINEKADRLDYLAVLARQRIDSWLCELCVRFHPVASTYLPTGYLFQFSYGDTFHYCKTHARRLRSREYNNRGTEYAPQPLAVTYREVQVSLKYTRILWEDRAANIGEEERRLTEVNRTVLKHLMQPRKLTLCFGYLDQLCILPAAFTCYAVPKIVRCSDGELHYLMLFVYESYRSGRVYKNPQARHNMEWICPHLRLSYTGHREMIERGALQMQGRPEITNHQRDLQQRYGNTYFWPNFHRRRPIRKAFDNSQRSRELEAKTAKGKARDKKERNKKELKEKKKEEKNRNKEKQGQNREGQEQGEQNGEGVLVAQGKGAAGNGNREILTSCHRCPTDITHRGTRTYVYRSFGSERSVTSVEWQIQLSGNRHYFGDQETSRISRELRNDQWGDLAVYHRPGTVEALYEGLPDVPATDGRAQFDYMELH